MIYLDSTWIGPRCQQKNTTTNIVQLLLINNKLLHETTSSWQQITTFTRCLFCKEFCLLCDMKQNQTFKIKFTTLTSTTCVVNPIIYYLVKFSGINITRNVVANVKIFIKNLWHNIKNTSVQYEIVSKSCFRHAVN